LRAAIFIIVATAADASGIRLGGHVMSERTEHTVAATARALSGSALGIIALGLVLVEAVLAIAVATGRVGPPDSHWLIAFVVVFPFFVYGVFVSLVKWYPQILLLGLVRDSKLLVEAIVPKAMQPLPHKMEPWRDPAIFDSDRLIGGGVTSTTIMSLFASLQGAERWNYVVVDVQAGRRWLASRLFIFAILLRAVRGLRCIVFVQTDAGLNRKLLGIAAPGAVRRALAVAYPWFEESLTAAVQSVGVPYFVDDLSGDQAFQVMQAFVTVLQSFDDKNGDNEWVKLDGGSWEHSRWLDATLAKRNFAGAFFSAAGSTIRGNTIQPDMELYVAVMKCTEPFAALINPQDEFLELYDRQSVVNRVADQVYAAVRSA
jgi:hypothetical protein